MQRSAFRPVHLGNRSAWMIGVAAAAAAGMAAAGWMALARWPSADATLEPLYSDRELTPQEMIRIEQTLAQRGLGPWETRDHMVLAPKCKRHLFLAALSDAHTAPEDFDAALENAAAESSPFDTRQARDLKLKIALQKELARIVASMNGIVEATIKYDEILQRGLQERWEKRALVAARGEDRRPLQAAQVESIRHTVAAAIAGMNPQCITVTDLNNGRTWTGKALVDPAESLAPADNRDLPSEIESLTDWTQRLAHEVRQALQAAAPGARHAVADAEIHVRWMEAPPNQEVERTSRSTANAVYPVRYAALGNQRAAIGRRAPSDAPPPWASIQSPQLMAWIILPANTRGRGAELLEHALREAAERALPEFVEDQPVRRLVRVGWRRAATPPAALEQEHEPERERAVTASCIATGQQQCQTHVALTAPDDAPAAAVERPILAADPQAAAGSSWRWLWLLCVVIAAGAGSRLLLIPSTTVDPAQPDSIR